MEVSCLLKAVAIAMGIVWIVRLEEMSWSGGVVVWLPEIVLSSLEECVGLCLYQPDSTVLIHICLFVKTYSFLLVIVHAKHRYFHSKSTSK